MFLKKKKFNNVKHIYQIFDKNNIILFMHVNNLNSIQTLIIKNFCFYNQIISYNFKLNLLKKISKNPIYNNLINGPTKIFIFDDILKLELFLNFFFVKKFFIPLAFYINNQFICYDFFFNYLKKTKNIKKLNDNKATAQFVIMTLINFNKNLMFFYIMKSLFLVLNVLKKNK